MRKYIDADKAIVEIEHHIRTGDELYPLSFGEKCINEGLGIATSVVDCMPPADVQEVVRCENCKYTYVVDDQEIWCFGRGGPMRMVPAAGFCDIGDRRDG